MNTKRIFTKTAYTIVVLLSILILTTGSALAAPRYSTSNVMAQVYDGCGNHNHYLNDVELLAAINDWAVSMISDQDLLALIDIWANNEYIAGDYGCVQG